jgi:hypothetical protein
VLPVGGLSPSYFFFFWFYDRPWCTPNITPSDKSWGLSGNRSHVVTKSSSLESSCLLTTGEASELVFSDSETQRPCFARRDISELSLLEDDTDRDENIG